MKKILLILPCFNEEESLTFTTDSLKKIRSQIKNYKIDIIFINDGSSDNTQIILRELAAKDDFIFYRELSRNRGHQTALRAGIDVIGDYDAAIMMDADLQHPPELIPKMIEVWESGVKVVQMVRKDNEQIGPLKYLVRHGYYNTLNWLSGLNIEYGASDFRLVDGDVARKVAESPESDLFLRGYFSWLPVSRETIIYQPNKRVAGASKYSLKKLLHLANRGVLQFSEKPLKVAVTVGVIMAALSFLYGLFLIVQHFVGAQNVSGWASLMVVMLFCFGLNFIMLGVVGTYLAHSISIQKKRPEYMIASEILPG